MIRALVLVAAAISFAPAAAAQWQLQAVPTVGPVKAIEMADGEPAIGIGHGWFRIIADGNRIRLVATAGPHRAAAASRRTPRRPHGGGQPRGRAGLAR